MDKEQFEFLKFCHFCKTKKLCKCDSFDPNISVYHGTFICYECEEKRYEAEKERKRLMSVSNLALATMGL